MNEFPDQHDPMEISEAELRGLTQDLGDVHVEVVERVGFEGTFIGLVAGDIWQTRDAVAL